MVRVQHRSIVTGVGIKRIEKLRITDDAIPCRKQYLLIPSMSIENLANTTKNTLLRIETLHPWKNIETLREATGEERLLLDKLSL
jgi:hypothetical protein